MENGESNGVVWVTFDGSRLELDVASKVLAMLKRDMPVRLGEYVGAALVDSEPRPVGRKRSG